MNICDMIIKSLLICYLNFTNSAIVFWLLSFMSICFMFNEYLPGFVLNFTNGAIIFLSFSFGLRRWFLSFMTIFIMSFQIALINITVLTILKRTKIYFFLFMNRIYMSSQ